MQKYFLLLLMPCQTDHVEGILPHAVFRLRWFFFFDICFVHAVSPDRIFWNLYAKGYHI